MLRILCYLLIAAILVFSSIQSVPIKELQLLNGEEVLVLVKREGSGSPSSPESPTEEDEEGQKEDEEGQKEDGLNNIFGG
jgi:ribosomal protein L12E/L44/L45/RPP1/RPP2